MIFQYRSREVLYIYTIVVTISDQQTSYNTIDSPLTSLGGWGILATYFDTLCDNLRFVATRCSLVAISPRPTVLRGVMENENVVM